MDRRSIEERPPWQTTTFCWTKWHARARGWRLRAVAEWIWWLDPSPIHLHGTISGRKSQPGLGKRSGQRSRSRRGERRVSRLHCSRPRGHHPAATASPTPHALQPLTATAAPLSYRSHPPHLRPRCMSHIALLRAQHPIHDPQWQGMRAAGIRCSMCMPSTHLLALLSCELGGFIGVGVRQAMSEGSRIS